MGLFDRFAERASHFTSRAWFFGFCVVLVLVWAPSLPLFGSLDTWQLVINTATTIITFLLVALLQNSQWRGNKATNQKLDAVAGGLADTMDAMDQVLDALKIHGDQHQMDEAADRLRRSVGIEDRLSSSGRDTADPKPSERDPAGPVDHTDQGDQGAQADEQPVAAS
jgi:low affinity Fe/Cu permease